MTIVDLVQEWTNDFSTALRQVESKRSETTVPLQVRAIERSALALRCVVAALQKVRDKRTAVAAAQILQADCARLRPGPTHVIEEALTLLEDHIINRFEVEQDLGAWANAVRLVRSRIEPDQRAALQDAIDADIEAFAAKHHLNIGMFVRNLLRRHHLQVPSLDEVWLRILSEALADPPTEGSELPPFHTVYVEQPRMVMLRMERRWAYITNVRQSRTQFVLYRLKPGFQLVVEGESGKDLTLRGPGIADSFASIGDAYEAVLEWLSMLLKNSPLIGGKLKHITIVDTTNEDGYFEMGNVWMESGEVLERRCFVPETLDPLN